MLGGCHPRAGWRGPLSEDVLWQRGLTLFPALLPGRFVRLVRPTWSGCSPTSCCGRIPQLPPCRSRCSGITRTVYCGLKVTRVVSDVQQCPRMVAPSSQSAGPRSESTPCVGASRRCSRRSLAMPLTTPPFLRSREPRYKSNLSGGLLGRPLLVTAVGCM